MDHRALDTVAHLQERQFLLRLTFYHVQFNFNPNSMEVGGLFTLFSQNLEEVPMFAQS